MDEKYMCDGMFLALNDIFADIINVAFFDGECVIKENDLETVSEKSLYTINDNLPKQAYDVAKYWKKSEFRIGILGLEGHTDIDISMPLRLLSHDGEAYYNQIHENKKNENWHPLLTLFLYFGNKPLSTPLSLSDYFPIDERLRPLFKDYKLNILDIPRLTYDTIAKFKTEFRLVVEYFKSKVDKTTFYPKNDLITHSNSFFNFMLVLTNEDWHFKESLRYSKYFEKNGCVHMCEIINKINQDIEIGKAQGIEIGKTQSFEICQAKTQYSNIKLLMKNLGFTLNQALTTLNITSDEWDHFKIVLGEK